MDPLKTSKIRGEGVKREVKKTCDEQKKGHEKIFVELSTLSMGRLSMEQFTSLEQKCFLQAKTF